MKKSFLMVALLLFVNTIYAQTSEFGIKIGSSFNKLSGEYSSSLALGYQIGSFYELKGKTFGVQPEVLYQYLPAAKVFGPFGDRVNFHMASMPILLNVHSNEHLSLQLGPQMNYTFAMPHNNSNNIVYDFIPNTSPPPPGGNNDYCTECTYDIPDQSAKNYFNRFVADFVIGFRGNIPGGYHVSGRYNMSLNDITKKGEGQSERKYVTLSFGKKF